jgi:mono/diheme cytochrome c family protein
MAVLAANYEGPPIQLAGAPSIFNGEEAALHEPLRSMFTWPGYTPAAEVSMDTIRLNDRERRLFSMGRQRYLSVCAGCHGTSGEGIRRFAPPLAGSDWVVGDETRLVRIVLHGLEGPIDVAGKRYDAPDILPVMPPHSVMDDEELASVLTYIRRAWGHTAAPVSPRTVGGLRHSSQGKTLPWTPEELLALPVVE